MTKTVLVSALCLLLLACSSQKKIKPIPEKDFIPLLVDLHIYDAAATNTAIVDNYGRMDSSILYSTILGRYGYSKEELVYSFEHYSNTPEKLMEIYDAVFANLSRISEETKEKYNTYSIQNTTPVWRPGMNRIAVKGKEKEYPLPYTIEIKDTGTYIFTANIKLTKFDKSVNPKVIAYFFNESDTLGENWHFFDTIELTKSKYSREYLLLKTIEDTSLNRLKLIIPQVEEPDSSYFKEFDMFNLRIARMKYESAAEEKN